MYSDGSIGKIGVSFKDTEEDRLLKQQIEESAVYMSKSAWMKIAAREKIDRERGFNPQNEIPMNKIPTKKSFLQPQPQSTAPMMTSPQIPSKKTISLDLIGSLGDLKD